MKRYLLAVTILTSFYLTGDESCDTSENETVSEEDCIKFRPFPFYENSTVRDPIEREPVNRRPNYYESSFYEQLTR